VSNFANSSSSSDSDEKNQNQIVRRKRKSSRLENSSNDEGEEKAKSFLEKTRNKNAFVNSSSDESENIIKHSEHAMVKEKVKSKRTPISGEKDARLNELEKLKAKRNSMKTNSLPVKAKQKLEFQQSKVESSDSEKDGFEYGSSDDFVRSNNGNSESETETESEYEDDGFVVSDEENLIDDGENDYVSSDDVNEEMTKLKEALSRSSEKHIKFSNQYLEELHKDQLGSRKKAKNQQKIKEKIKADPDVFQRLVNGLRKHATNPKLSDKKIVNQFECVGFDRDEFATEKCVCGKEELKWLYYMKNKKKINEEYALSTFIVGSSCINTFYKSRKEKNKIYKGHNPIEFTFMQWSQKGIIGNFRKQIKIPVKISKNGKVKEFQRNAWVITVSNKAVFEDFDALEKEYSTSIQPKVNNAIEITVIVSENVLNKMKKTYLKDSNCLEKNTRHKFFLNFKIDDHTQMGKPPIPINFHLSKLENPEASNFRCSEPTSGKDFLT